MAGTISVMRFMTIALISGFNVLTVPIISEVSGITLNRVPEVILPTVMTAGSSTNSASRLMMVCKPSIIFAEIKIGSTPVHGVEP